MKKSFTQKTYLLGKSFFLLLFSIILTTVNAQTQCIDKLDFKYVVDHQSKTVKYIAVASKGALAFEWDFGNKKGSKDKEVKQTYDSAGYYKVCLTAYGFDKTTKTRCSTTVCKRIKINNCNLLKVDFSSATDGLTAKFEAKSNSKTVVYGWSLGDNSAERGAAVKHTYSKEGGYKVCLIAKDTVTGCEARVCKEIKVENPCKLEAAFEFSRDGLTVKVAAKSNSKSVVYGWTFGDGSSERGRESKHTYTKVGGYTICLVAKDTTTGCVVRVCKDVKFEDPCELKGEFVFSQDGNDFKFNAKSNGKTARYVWKFGDDESAKGAEVKHTYKKPGTYEVCVLIFTEKTETSKGCEIKVCKRVIVKGKTDCDLRASFTYKQNGTKIATMAESNEKGILYYWSWGDGTSGHGISATHKYKKYGVYEVCLIAFNPKTKCKVCVCKRVVVEKPCRLKTRLKYTIDGNNVQFKARSNSKNVVYGWSFGDGNSDRGNPVKHEYKKPGIYTVKLIAKDTNSGCIVTKTFKIIINAKNKRSTVMIGEEEDGMDVSQSGAQTPEAESSNWTASAYPVPASGTLAFEADKDLKSVRILNSSGTQVYKNELGSTEKIDISTLPTGYYFAHLTAADGTVKVVKFAKSE